MKSSLVTPTKTALHEDVSIPIKTGHLEGELVLPHGAAGMVLFAHGSGSSRHSPRNQYVARIIQEACVGTLLFDLLTRPEEREDNVTGELRFNIDFLAERLITATNWVLGETHLQGLNLGYFGSSTGGAAALVAAAKLGSKISAIVSRGGRPDLADRFLPKVTSPTLLIVGGHDDQVLALNEQAFARLSCRKELKIIPGATHLFEEPGALQQVARIAAEWFAFHLATEKSRNPLDSLSLGTNLTAPAPTGPSTIR